MPAINKNSRHKTFPRRLLPITCYLLAALILTSCRPTQPPTSTPNTQHPTPNTQYSILNTHPLFRNVAAESGVNFQYRNGATGKFNYIEETGAGCALFDYDNDGWLDIYLVQSGTFPRQKGSADSANFGVLYHNDGTGKFIEVTVGSGLDKDLDYGQAVAVGDYDNDGFDDLFISGYGGNHLMRNDRGTGKFIEVTEKAGVGDTAQGKKYAVSAAFGDYDNDGDLDLYVCRYAPWSPEKNKICHTATGAEDYCTPDVLDPESHLLYRNNGNGTFTDVSKVSGIASRKGHGLGVVWLDYNGDGWEDIFVSNDLGPQFLWHNNGNGTFTNRSEEAGCAFDYNASHLAGMGIGVADYNNSGRESLFVTNFSNQPNTLYRNVGDGLFEDASLQANLALPHMPYLAFGCDFADYDADGWRDLIVANGHVVLSVAETTDGVTYKERKQVFHNDGTGRFVEITENLGDLGTQTVSRGLATGDFDNDGRLDFLVSNQDSPAQLFHNEVTNLGNWVRLKLIGTKSNRDAYQAKVTVHVGKSRYFAEVRSSSSYASHSDSRLYFGLGPATTIDRIDIAWPSGKKESIPALPANSTYTITEGKGVTGKQLPAPSR